nr:hypothetical protein [Tanacetum cinerariifolium]
MVAYLSKSDASEGFNQILDFLNGSSIKLQALVDKKKVVVTKATIREALRLDDEEGVDCLPNEEIFAELARTGYEKPSTKLTSSMVSAVICLSLGRKFNFSKYIFDSLVDEEGDADENVEEVNAGDAAEGDVSVAHGEVHTVTEEPSNPSFTPNTPPPQPSQDIPSTSQLKRRVKKLKKRNKVRVLKLRRLQRVETSQRVKTSDKTVMDDVSNQGRMIAKVDADADVVLEDVKEDVKEEDETETAKVQEVVDVVTTAKLITEVVTTASETVTAALIRDLQEESTTSTIIPAETKSKDKGKEILVEEPKPLKKKQQIEQDEQYARELQAELNKNIDWDEAINHVKKKAKEDPAVKKYQVLKRKPQTEGQARKNIIVYLKNVAGFKMDYFKGMSYDDIRLIFKAKFNTNVAFLLKIKEQIKEDENRALRRLNETPVERVAKRQRLDEDVEELKRHLQIVPNEDDDVYTETTHLLKREDLKALWSLVKERFSTTKPRNFFDDFLLVTLEAMFEKPDIHAQIWKTQRNVHGPTKVKGWKLLKSCGVQIITFTSTQLILLVERLYPLTRFTLDQMLNAVRLEVEEESEVSLELLRFIRQQHQEGQQE